MREFLVAATPEPLQFQGRQTRTRPAPAACILGICVSVLIVAGLYAAGRDQVLRMAIPLLATLIAVSLYFSRPVAYVQYSLWIWFLSPFVRRIVDCRFGYTEPNLVLAAPLLVSGVAGLTLVLPSRRTTARIPTSFVLCGAAILYAFIVGMILNPSGERIYGLCNWLSPLLFGSHLFLTWGQHKEYCVVITKTFLSAMLILGLYGICQYFAPPAWDRYWLENVMVGGQNLSFGRPEALQIRVWGTLNSPGPFANTLMVGLLLLLSPGYPWKIVGAISGYASFLLSMVRTSWLSLMCGIVIILINRKFRMLAGVLIFLMLLVVCLFWVFNDSRVAPVSSRFRTFLSLQQDESFRSRSDIVGKGWIEASANPFGLGLSNEHSPQNINLDNGILAVLLSLGWFGTFLFAAGVVHLLLANHRTSLNDDTVLIARAIVIAILLQIVAGNTFIGVNGMLFWTFSAIYLTGTKTPLLHER